MALAINSDISNELWQSALDTLERTFSKPVFEMWIKPIRFIRFTATNYTSRCIASSRKIGSEASFEGR